jgi:transposase
MAQHSGNQERLFYSFNLDEHVPADHLLRGVDRFLDLSDLRQHLAPFYSHTGRPSVDPELMLRMLLVRYCFGIRSERRLCEEVHLNLAYRWFCRLGLEDSVPDHSSFSKLASLSTSRLPHGCGLVLQFSRDSSRDKAMRICECKYTFAYV